MLLGEEETLSYLGFFYLPIMAILPTKFTATFAARQPFISGARPLPRCPRRHHLCPLNPLRQLYSPFALPLQVTLPLMSLGRALANAQRVYQIPTAVLGAFYTLTHFNLYNYPIIQLLSLFSFYNGGSEKSYKSLKSQNWGQRAGF